MYLPNLVNRNIDTRWLHEKTADVDYQSEMYPLSAYSPAFPGPEPQLSRKKYSVVQSYSNNTFPGHSHYIDHISSQVSSKLRYLESLKALGYDEIRPIGISRTLQESMDDQAQHTETSQSFIETGEIQEVLPSHGPPTYEDAPSEEYHGDASEEYNQQVNEQYSEEHLSEYNTSYLSDDDVPFVPPHQPQQDHVTDSQRRFQSYYQQHSPTGQNQRVGSSSLRHEISISDLNDDDWSMDI